MSNSYFGTDHGPFARQQFEYDSIIKWFFLAAYIYAAAFHVYVALINHMTFTREELSSCNFNLA